QGFVKPVSDLPMADLYVCWSPEALYLGIYAQDVVEPEAYRGKQVPDSDRAEWTVLPGKNGKAVRARIGAGGPAVINEPAVHISHLSGVELNTRCIAAVMIPASLFDRNAFQRGDHVEFASAFRSHCRVYRTDWRGHFTLRGK